MTQITAGTGLVSGIDYTTLINNMIKVESLQSDAITTQNTTLQKQQTAISTLMANLTALKGTADSLGQSSLFDTLAATSSNSGVISATTTGTPTAGTYQYTTLSKAQAQQLVSSSYDSSSVKVGKGTLSLRFGNTVDTSMSLNNINGGAGFTAGKIKITDRSGTANIIDLSGARTLDDVVTAINNNGLADVTASVSGDRIVLTDNTGATNANLKVQEVSSGKTAASLGLSGINTASNSATGSDIVYLSDSLNLNALNDGIGVEINTSAADVTFKLSNGDTGSIRLAGSTTIADIISKINGASNYLTASLSSDKTKLLVTDSSGGKGSFTLSAANNSQALSDLGLTGTAVKGVVAGTLDLSNGADTVLSSLNGGAGVRTIDSLPDIKYKLSNGNSGEINLNGATTLGDIIDKINAVNTKLKASINSTGDGLVLTDSSGGTTDTFSVVAENDSKALADLGLTGTAAGGVINGSRIISGAKTVLLSDLNGGNGLGTLGKIDLTDRTGNSATVDLAGAETLEDVINAINTSGLHITAQVNDAGNGIKVVDNSGQTTSNLKVENDADGTTTADKLFGSAVDVAANSANSGDMHLRYIGLNTKLADLNGGAGVTNGSFKITNSLGNTVSITVKDNMKTVADVIKTINLSTANVLAEINDTGDGIVIRDSNGGTGKLVVTENGSNTAASLNLLNAATTKDSSQVIDGAMTRTIDISDTDTLQNLSDNINHLHAGVTASIVSDGAAGYCLQLTSNKTGAQSAFILDTSKSSASFDWTAKAQDALLSVGSNSLSKKATLASSSTNTFTNVLSGVTLTVQSASTSPVTVTVNADTSNLASQINSFVNTYNSFRQTLSNDTAYDASTNTGSVLTGDYTAMQLEIQLGNLMSNYYSSGNTVCSMAQLGITVNDDGTLALNQDTLNSVLNTNLADVKALFTTADTGVSAQFSNLISNLAVDADQQDPKSLLGLHYQSLQTSIDKNQENIDSWTKRLDNERTRLTDQFANLETILAKIQNDYQALSSISWITADGSSDSTSSSSLFKNTSSSSSG
jgi:flagellar hook-associated protein 2